MSIGVLLDQPAWYRDARRNANRRRECSAFEMDTTMNQPLCRCCAALLLFVALGRQAVNASEPDNQTGSLPAEFGT
jgi:hypothetical protein